MKVKRKMAREYVGLHVDPNIKKRLKVLATKERRNLAQFLRLRLEQMANGQPCTSSAGQLD